MPPETTTDVLVAGGGPCGLMLAHFEWTLLVLGPDAPDTAAFERAAAERGMDLQVVRHPVWQLRELYEAPLALIRPDQIVAWRGQDASQADAVLVGVGGFGARGR